VRPEFAFLPLESPHFPTPHGQLEKCVLNCWSNSPLLVLVETFVSSPSRIELQQKKQGVSKMHAFDMSELLSVCDLISMTTMNLTMISSLTIPALYNAIVKYKMIHKYFEKCFKHKSMQKSDIIFVPDCICSRSRKSHFH